MPRYARREPRPDRGPADCFTIAEFCQRNRISRQFYSKLREQGKGPKEMRLGSRVLITREAADAWRTAMSA